MACNGFRRSSRRYCVRRTRSATWRRWRWHRIGWRGCRSWRVCRCRSIPTPGCSLVDTAVDGTTCLAWSKGATDHSAQISVLSGQGLPIPVGDDQQLVGLVKDVRDPNAIEADQAFIGKDATNLVMTTSAAPASDTRESMWWISDQGVRYGIELTEESLRALGLSPANARQAPWPLIRVFAPGPALEPRRRDDPARHLDGRRGRRGAAHQRRAKPGRRRIVKSQGPEPMCGYQAKPPIGWTP